MPDFAPQIISGLGPGGTIGLLYEKDLLRTTCWKGLWLTGKRVPYGAISTIQGPEYTSFSISRMC